MRILFIVGALFVLAGCESMALTSVTVSSGYHHVYPVGHISYTLGFYSGSHYNGYNVYGSHGHRYYYAPRHYSNHHYYSAPVIVHQHIHTAHCGHNYTPRHHYTPPATPRHTPPRHRNGPRHVQPQVRNDRNSNRRDHRQNDRRGNHNNRDRRQHRK